MILAQFTDVQNGIRGESHIREIGTMVIMNSFDFTYGFGSGGTT
jgi:hypothetical protein